VSAQTPSGVTASPVRPRHRAPAVVVAPPRHRAMAAAVAPPPRDPAFPDYPFFQAHDAEARRGHLYGRAGRRWGRHPGFPALDDALHLPGQRGSDRTVERVGRLGDVAVTAAVLVVAAAWVVAVAGPLPRAVALLSLAWVPAYLATCMWLELVHANSAAVAPRRQRRSSLAWPWLGWLAPFGALWVPKWLVDDAMWALPRAGLVHRVRWSGVWWTAFTLGAVAWLVAAVGPLVPGWPGELPFWQPFWSGELPGGLGEAPAALGDLARDLRFVAAGLLTVALAGWVRTVGRLTMISDQLADVKRSTLVR
jgi:hypothetical protein